MRGKIRSKPSYSKTSNGGFENQSRMKILIYKNYEKLQNVKTFTKKALIDSKIHVTIIQQLFIGLIHIVCKRVHKVAKRECWKNKDQWKCLKKNKNES